MGAVFMLNTMVMSVFERTREIGILRAIGWRPWRIMRMILMESVLLSLGGGVVGTIGAIGLTWFLSRLPVVNGVDPAAITLAVIVVKGFVIALLVGLIGAAYPAYRGATTCCPRRPSAMNNNSLTARLPCSCGPSTSASSIPTARSAPWWT